MLLKVLVSSPNTSLNRPCVKYCVYSSPWKRTLSVLFSFFVEWITHFLQTAMPFRHYPINTNHVALMSGCWRNRVAVNHKGFNHSIICIWFFPVSRCMPTYCLTFRMSESSVFVPLYDFPPFFSNVILQIWTVWNSQSDASMWSKRYPIWCSRTEIQSWWSMKDLGWNMKYWKSACFTNHTVAWTSLAPQPQNVKTEQLIPSWTADWMLATRHNVV